MKKRIEMVGGRLTIEPAPGKGATVRAEIPFTQDKAKKITTSKQITVLPGKTVDDASITSQVKYALLSHTIVIAFLRVSMTLGARNCVLDDSGW